MGRTSIFKQRGIQGEKRGDYEVLDCRGDFWGRDADKIGEQEFTGNASVPPSFRYHDSVCFNFPHSADSAAYCPSQAVLLVPRANIYHDFTDYAVLVENLLPEVLKDLSGREIGPIERDALVQYPKGLTRSCAPRHQGSCGTRRGQSL